MEESFWRPGSRSAGHETSRISEHEDLYRVHKSPLVPLLNHVRPVHKSYTFI
jgi:hypothetical protein